MLPFLSKVGAKLTTSLSTFTGWLTVLGTFIADYFAGHVFICFLVVFITIMDAAWGIAVSVKQGKFTLSELARLTIVKLAIYGCTLSAFVGLDKMIGEVISASIIGAIIVLIELWSSCASMLILYPQMTFLRLLKKYLTGEIASKLGVEPNEVEETLKTLEKNKKGIVKKENSINTNQNG